MKQSRSQVWSYAIGMAFFAMSLSIFLPFAAAVAGGGASSNPVLNEICGIGGVQLVAPATTEDIANPRISHSHEYCGYCGLGDSPAISFEKVSLPSHTLVSIEPLLILEDTIRSRIWARTILIRGPPKIS